MEQPFTHIPHPMIGSICTLISVCTGIIAAIPADIEIGVRTVAGIAAIVSAIFAARYYRIAYLEKQESLKNLKSLNNEKHP